MKKGPRCGPSFRSKLNSLALLLVLAAFILTAFVAHLALAVFLLLLAAALARTISALLAALITALIVLVRHLSLLCTPLPKAAI